MASGERRIARSRKEQCFGKSEARLDVMAPIAPYTAPTAAPDGPDWEVRGPSPVRFHGSTQPDGAVDPNGMRRIHSDDLD